MREQIDELFNKEMSRKEFLQHIVSGLLILFGMSGVIKALTQQSGHPGRRAIGGYGSSAYGGMKK
ncbi:MAG TPA: hypothetical protein VK674_04055 [Candidatus Limnocylindria bacterium]|nr:hypothetical protein [Candidatus Limnocylindria bacterium]